MSFISRQKSLKMNFSRCDLYKKYGMPNEPQEVNYICATVPYAKLQLYER